MSIQIHELTSPLAHGESPHWDAREQALYFVSSVEKTIHKYVLATGEHTKTQLGKWNWIHKDLTSSKPEIIMAQYYSSKSAKRLLLLLFWQAGGNRALWTPRHWTLSRENRYKGSSTNGSTGLSLLSYKHSTETTRRCTLLSCYVSLALSTFITLAI